MIARFVICAALAIATPMLAHAAENPFDKFDEKQTTATELEPWLLPWSNDPVIVSAQEARDRQYFDKCMAAGLKGMPTNGLPFVARQCVQLSIPKKCRAPQSISVECLESCKKASFISKKVGECSLGD